MKTSGIILICFVFVFSLQSQNPNLVPNPSFETYINCPTGVGQIHKVIPWFAACNLWPGYYNSCANLTHPIWGVPYNEMGNYQPAKTGNAYISIFAEQSPDNRRTYAGVKLSQPLVAGKQYNLGFWVCLGDKIYLAMDMLGAYVSVDSVGCPQGQIPPAYLLSFTPQVNNTPGNVITDTANWTLISGHFKADGGERFLVIGNFFPASQTTWQWMYPGYPRAGYLIDDVFLYEDSTTVGVAEPMVAVATGLSVYPNPASTVVQVMLPPEAQGELSLEMYTSTGQRVDKQVLIARESRITYNLDHLPSGFYLLHVRSPRGYLGQGKLVIMK